MSDIEVREEQKTEYLQYMDRLCRAVRVERPDKKRMSTLVEKAKGARSMRTFADQLGVNVSTVSRIINGQAETVSTELIAKIAACSASSEVTVKELMEAEGLTINRYDPYFRNRIVRSCRAILADELVSRGYTVRYPVVEDEHTYKCWSDFILYTDAIAEDARWLFDVRLLSADEKIGEEQQTKICFHKYMAFYYQGGQASRISVVLSNRVAYERVIGYTSQYKRIPDEISIMLIDIAEGRVLDEYILPMKGEQNAKKIF